jgi:hypothetical protein
MPGEESDPLVSGNGSLQSKCTPFTTITVVAVVIPIAIIAIAYFSAMNEINKMNVIHNASISRLNSRMSDQQSNLENVIFQVENHSRNCSYKINESRNVFEDKLQPIYEQLRYSPKATGDALELLELTFSTKLDVFKNVTSSLIKDNRDLKSAINILSQNFLNFQVFKVRVFSCLGMFCMISSYDRFTFQVLLRNF